MKKSHANNVYMDGKEYSNVNCNPGYCNPFNKMKKYNNNQKNLVSFLATIVIQYLFSTI